MTKRAAKEFCKVVRHPVLQHKLCQLRDKNTTPWMFRNLMEDVSQLLAYEVGRDPVSYTHLTLPTIYSV